MTYISASKRAKASQTKTANDKTAILINTIRKRSGMAFTSSSGKNLPNVKPIERSNERSK